MLRPPSRAVSASAVSDKFYWRRVKLALRFLTIATRGSGGDSEIECKDDCHSGMCCFPDVGVQTLWGEIGKDLSRRREGCGFQCRLRRAGGADANGLNGSSHAGFGMAD